MKIVTRYASIFLLALFVQGCAQLPTATGFNEKIAVAISTVTAVRTTATTLLTEKKITADDGQNVLVATDNARTGIEVARTLSRVNLAAADSKLTAITASLQALSTYLASRK